MLLLGVVRLAAYRRGIRPGRRPDGSFPARQPTHTVGQDLTVASGSFLASPLVGLAQEATAGWSPVGGRPEVGTQVVAQLHLSRQAHDRDCRRPARRQTVAG